MERAVTIIRAGGVVVYPTETLYALGCDCFNADAAARVSALKGRPAAKPLPVVIGSEEQIGLVAAKVGDVPRALMDAFWPGPLSILLQGVKALPCLVCDPGGLVSVRMTPHPVARDLCVAAGTGLVATSANRSGMPAVSRPADLDPEIVAGADATLADEPFPAGGEASTLVRVDDRGRVVVLRPGAVPVADVRAAGFVVIE